METLPENWNAFLGDQLDRPALDAVLCKVAEERAAGTVFPPEGCVFTALRLTPPESVRAVILGQDPYHDTGQAQGMAFSVPYGVTPPPSLRNIFQEYANDLNAPAPDCGSLKLWAENGVLLLNTVLTVRAHCPASHKNLGWEAFTDSVISALSQKSPRLAFLLWGSHAQSKIPLIDGTKHLLIVSPHPSPFSAHRGFFGSRPFSRAEEYLKPWRWPRFTVDDLF